MSPRVHDASAESAALYRADYRESADQQLVRELALRAGRQLEEGDIGQAETTLRLALAKVPDDPRCRSFLAICLASGRHKYVTADKVARGVLDQYPNDPTAHFALGRINLLAGRRRQAFRYFARARALAVGARSLTTAVDRQDPRRSPVIPSLARGHALNILLGRLCRRFGPKRDD
jgi:Flp pilus assembly protein TadD